MADNTQSLQYAFAAHIRDPENNPAPADIEDRRMKVYRELFFNNVNRLLSFSFPVIRKLYDDDGWRKLARSFYADHRCLTPLFPELPREFLRYIQEQRQDHPDDPPFLLELAHYEWVELALSLDENELDDLDVDSEADLLTGSPVLSPLAWPLSYQYPVHRISPDFRPDEPPEEPTHLLVYRNRADKVKFMQLNPITRMLLEIMQENTGSSGREMLIRLGELARHPDPEQLIGHGHQLLIDLQARDIVPGCAA